MLRRRSPMELRRGADEDALEPYQPPRTLARQSHLQDSARNQDQVDLVIKHKQPETKQPKRSRWLPKLSSLKTHHNQSLNERLSNRFVRLSSLDSTQSNSSMELEPNHLEQAHSRQVAPLISITSNEAGANQQQQVGEMSAMRRRQEAYRNYYGRSRHGINAKNQYNGRRHRREEDQDEEAEEEDDDAFEDLPLPMPYSSAAMQRSNIIRQQTDNGTVSYPATYEELLDDRQGMNNSEQQFTKGEKANRSSLDGSISGDPKTDDGKKTGGKAGKKEKQRRSKSPSSSLNRRRHSRRGFMSRFNLTKKHESIAKLQLSILNSGFVSLKTLDRDLQSFLPKDRLALKDFQERVRLMRKFDVLSSIEYRFASKYETYVCKHALQETNQPKNNYKKCIPYDYNRVVLKTLPNVPDSDYINASHVDSLLKPNAYIAAQGPNENTIEDFWRMIWEQKTFVIVMLTKVFDFIRVMCNQYWPVEVNKPERYGNVEVTLLYEEPLADFVIRTIRLVRLRGGNQTAEAEEEEEDKTAGIEPKSADVQASPSVNDKSMSDDNVGLSDETSDSEQELVLNETKEIDSSMQNLAVRSPRFVAAKRRVSRSRPGQSPSVQPTASTAAETAPGPSSQEELALKGSDQRPSIASEQAEVRDATKRTSQQNDLLHPLFNLANITASQTSLSSEPATPLTPRTPSSAGLDRSSATRKAVKKKRRERIKNQRPKRTQFMVPTESQLKDDDDDDDDDKQTTGSAAAKEEQTAGRSNERIIYQFHYNSWASHTCPFVSSLLHFRRRVRICMDEMSKSGRTGPTVVHCNDGCGRTGTYLCIDANLELAEEDSLLDVYNYARKMRQSRKFLIENLEQYKFAYDTIDEALFCGRTWFPVADLHKRLKHKSQRNPVTKKNEYLVEYEKICQMTTKFSIGDCAGGHRVENREKNRDVSTVPPDNFRPYLTSFQTNDSTDYINAVFVDGYTRSKEYIVTEWPLHRTISDFWSLVYDHDCNSVILLANPQESSTYPSFLPSEKELRRKFGPVFSAEMVSYTHYQNIKSWIYTINKKIVSLTEVIAGVKSEAKTTQVFQITCWPQGHRVPTSTNALVELMNMVERWRQRTTYGPVCVVSLNGKSRAGVYCAANVAIEQVVQHSEVDVFNAVKTVRRHRPQLIENMTEYKYCYDLILHYVLHYVNNQSPTNS